MEDLQEFKEWLFINTKYTKETVSDILSRLKRANSILPWFDDDIYLFELERREEFKKLSSSVRSQIRRAIGLYFEYLKKSDSEEI